MFFFYISVSGEANAADSSIATYAVVAKKQKERGILQHKLTVIIQGF